MCRCRKNGTWTEEIGPLCEENLIGKLYHNSYFAYSYFEVSFLLTILGIQKP